MTASVRIALCGALLLSLPFVAAAQLPGSDEAKKKKVPADTTREAPFPTAALTFVFGDDNLLVGAGETRKSSPAPYFGKCHATTIERADPNDCGDSMTNLLLYKRLKVSPYFQPEGALSLDLRFGEDVDLADAGSFIRANFFMDKRHETYWAVTMYPVDADKMRLGYHYDTSWGGTDSFPKNFRRGYAPGVQFDLDYRYWYLFVGFKGAQVRGPSTDILDNPGGNELKIVERSFYGGLLGTGFEFGDSGVRLEANGGFFNKGTNPRQNALGEPIYAGGASARLSFRRGLPIGRRIDAGLFQIDRLREELLRKEQYRVGKLSVAVEGEFSWLIQNLEDPDHVDSTKNESSYMGHLGLKLKYGYWRLHVDAIYRDLTAILFDVPGFVPFQGLSEDVEVSPEIFTAISTDYNIQPIDLTIGVTLGLQIPATYTGVAPTGNTASEVDQGNRKVVIRNPTSWDILPPGEDELPLFVARLDVKWSYYDTFYVIASLWYGRDDNLASVTPDAAGHNVRDFEEPNAVGFTLLSQMRF